MSYTLAAVIRKLALFAFIVSVGVSTFGQNLEAGFATPPNSAKPRVWWHWMNGNITKEGIKLDLEWMNRVGIGGFQNFDASLGTPKLVDKRLIYMTPEWKDAFLFTTKLADQLGLEEAIAGSPGWSESGGPWVKPSQGMKKVVWSETRIEGGKPFNGVLPHPPTVSGPIQYSDLRFSGHDRWPGTGSAAVLLRRQRSHRLSRTRKRCPCVRAATKDYFERREPRPSFVNGRRLGQNHTITEGPGRAAGVGPV